MAVDVGFVDELKAFEIIVVFIIKAEVIMLSKMQKAYLESEIESGKAESDVLAALNDFLFAEVVHCLNGDWSTGSTQNGDGEMLPALYASLSEAKEAYRDALNGFNEMNDDPDDVYEGEIVAVRWKPDDTLEFYLIDGDEVVRDGLVGSVTALRAMGL